jgi:bifunctional non-homologous end joining protein LigD
MQRFPDGIGGEVFFQKQIPDYFPDWIDRVTLAKEGGRITHALCNDAATMVYLANQVCVPHLALARADRPRNPDRFILDLDPSDGDFHKVQAAARLAHRLLVELDLVSFVQTTGSRGLHIVLPLDRRADFSIVKEFAVLLCDELAARAPAALTTEKRKAKRGSRVFLDYLRNDYAQTAVAPYAVRPKPGAPVATPLDWSEVGSVGLTAQKFTMSNLFRRLARKDDPWAGIGRHRQGLARASRRLDAMARDRRGR